MMLKTETNRISIDILADSLGAEESLRDVCPICCGGQSREKSFVISRDSKGKIWYRCFRATCGVRGVKFSEPQWPHEKANRDQIRTFSKAYDQLTDSQKEWFANEFDIKDLTGVYYCPEMEAYVYKVLGPRSEFRGFQARKFVPKLCLTYQSNYGEFIGWIRPLVHSQEVVVVEDYLSALKVAEAGYNVVCLFGTVINYSRCFEIAEFANRVHLALDKGQTKTMIEYRDKFGIIWGETIIWSLDKDLKYVPHLRIKKAMEDGAIDFLSNYGSNSGA